MKSLMQLSLPALLVVCGVAFAQEPEATPDAAAQAERQARVGQRPELTREERQIRREAVRERWEGLSEAQRQAVRERRQERQAARPEGQRVRPPAGQRPLPKGSNSGAEPQAE